MLSVFVIFVFVCLVRRPLPVFFAVFFFRVASLYKFSERTFEFGCVWLVGIVRCFFASISALLERVLPEKCAKEILSLSGPCFLHRSLFLKLCRRRLLAYVLLALLSLYLLFFLLRDKDQANRSHSPCKLCWSCSLFFFCFSPDAAVFSFCLSARSGRASLCFCVFSGVRFSAPCVFGTSRTWRLSFARVF